MFLPTASWALEALWSNFIIRESEGRVEILMIASSVEAGRPPPCFISIS
jgi:hypothetical protein